MAPRTSSLRQRHSRAALTACVVLAALTSTGAALGAGGAPLPGPDDPPSTLSTRSVKAPATKTSTTTSSRTDAPAQHETSTTPSPDPPGSTTTTKTTKTTRTAPAQAPAAARPAPVAATPIQPAVTQPSVSRPAPSNVTRANRTTPKPKPKPKPKATAKAAAHPAGPRTTRPVLKPPHDVRRLGLPLARLVPAADGESTRTALLVAAAVLLVASGAGSLTVGVSVRRLARGA